MTLADLEHALKAEVDTGRLGVPVALRIHAAVPAIDGELLIMLGFFRPLLSLIGDVSRGHVQAKQHSSGKECTVLWTEETGKTAFLTLASPASGKQTLQLLLIGNHGTTQFQGGEDWRDSLTAHFPMFWETEIQESLRKGTSIRVKAS